jgi:hypothetical protein
MSCNAKRFLLNANKNVPNPMYKPKTPNNPAETVIMPIFVSSLIKGCMNDIFYPSSRTILIPFHFFPNVCPLCLKG